MDRINNNIKFYTFIDILETYSDKNVSLSIKEINNHMKKRLGIVLDRRTIYNYMRDMKALGFDVSDYDKHKEGYYLNSHSLEPYEIKILSDAVLTSNFITKGKSLELLGKLKSFNSIYQNRDFIDNIFIEDIPKSTNEEIFANMMVIDGAIKEGKKIRFNYCNYDCFKNLVYRVDADGERKVYVKSPVYMILRNKNYYLVCAEENSNVLKNYRVDRMLNVTKLEEDITELSGFLECRNGFNPMEYLRRSFKMFGGELSIIMVEFKRSLLNYLLDEFGDYVYIMEKGNFENNNLSEKIRWEHLSYQILEKILGEKTYEEYILSGKYIEDGYARDVIDSFSEKMKSIVEDYGMIEAARGEREENVEKEVCDGAFRAHQKGIIRNYKIVDDSAEKKYIGVFVAKGGMGIVKWIMQFGVDMEVIFPESVREMIRKEIDSMKDLYSKK